MKRKSFFGILTVTLLSAAMFSFAGCKDDGGDTPPPPPPTPTDPSTIAAANLVAYFPFESETASIDKGAGATFNKKGGAASFAPGRRGNCYLGTATGDGSYLEYDLAANNFINGMGDFTVAAWLKGTYTGKAGNIFNFNGGDATMGSLTWAVENNSEAQMLNLKGYFYDTANEGDWKGQEYVVKNEAFVPNKWVHVVWSYNGTTSTMQLYANGVLLVEQIKYAGADPDEEGPLPQPVLGPNKLDNSTKLYVGAWSQLVLGEGVQDAWMTYYNGSLDELRIYSKALAATEVKQLYDAEVANINK